MSESICRTDGQSLVEDLQREINALRDPHAGKRKQALVKLYEVLVATKPPLRSDVVQVVLVSLQKQLLKSVEDPVEKCRELSVNILKELYSRCEDLTSTFPFLFPILMDRLGAYDPEGTSHLPDILKPPKNQKPQVVVKPPEPSEEVRLLIAELVNIVVCCAAPESFTEYLDELVSLLRVLAMDPYGQVQLEAAKTISELSRAAAELIHHFSEPLARSLFTPITNKHSKVRIAGVEALGQVMYAGVWKYNSAIMEGLIGFRDPNVVPIKDFYEYTTKLNYFALLARDRTVQVRDMFYRVISDWLLKLPDRVDHEARLVPYMLSGLSDSSGEIQNMCFEQLEEIGEMIEEEKEKEIRDQRQLGVDAEWTNDGELVNLPLPAPWEHRPRLGARMFIRSHIFKFLKALYRELHDWNVEAKIRASQMLLCAIVYAEDLLTQHLEPLLFATYRTLLDAETPEVPKTIAIVFKLIGRYCPPVSYFKLIKAVIKCEVGTDVAANQHGAILGLSYIVKGVCEAIPSDKGIGRLGELLPEILEMLEEHSFISGLDRPCREALCQLLRNMVIPFKNRIKKLKNGSEYLMFTDQILRLLVLLESSFIDTRSLEDPGVLQTGLGEYLHLEDIIEHLTDIVLYIETKHKITSEKQTILVRNLKTFLQELDALEDHDWHIHSVPWKEFIYLCFKTNSSDLEAVPGTVNRLLDIQARILGSEKHVNLHFYTLRLFERTIKLVGETLPLHSLYSRSAKLLVAPLRPAETEKLRELKSRVRIAVCGTLFTLHEESVLKVEEEFYDSFVDIVKSLTNCLQDPLELTRVWVLQALELVLSKLRSCKDSSRPNGTLKHPDYLPKLFEVFVDTLSDPSDKVRLQVFKSFDSYLDLLTIDKSEEADINRMIESQKIVPLLPKDRVSARNKSVFGENKEAVRKLLIMALDEQDPEIRERIVVLLSGLAEKLRKVFIYEYQEAKVDGSLKRESLVHDLLARFIKLDPK